MLNTVNHFLNSSAFPEASFTTSIDPNESVECEVNCLSDFEDDDDDDLIEITSRGSMTPDSLASPDSLSLADDQGTSVFSSGSTAGNEDFLSSIQQRLEGLTPNVPVESTPDKDLVTLGEVTVTSPSLDFSLISLDSEHVSGLSLEQTPRLQPAAIPLETYLDHIEETPHDAAIRTYTPDGETIGGTLSGSSSYVRLPHSSTFQEVYIGKLNRPLIPGDCGSWVRDAVSGKLYGHVHCR